ncbi:AraC family transcriptional regulator [Falsiroseomonas selenitidurans]|uniref:Helix-turn-helix domain-containing protein n=1 Tax=Falsiroseomonas selenitidurans TaxID=2716335 RepID=A0ABX1E7E6_9PROT|nr:GyrI-like domain-containing protein [Falsiroseomonas selenitidurans]NKC33106.1 helix-turn-helix domain-containing protein [Falsiroseomonas selenitidurans]
MALKLPTRQDYARRIARAIALIAADPARNPGLEDLAAAAAFSPFHFHRIYREITGETPAETLARERLSRAAGLLARERLPIAAVARRCGYGSAAAFTRAFRAAYGVPPAAYRDAGGIGRPRPEPGDEEDWMNEVTIRDEPALRLATLAHRGPYMGIGTRFDLLAAWARARGLEGPATRWIGLFHDDPGSVPADALRAEAAMTVPEGVEASDGVILRTLPPTRLAVLVFRGPYAELERAYRRLYRDWLPGSGEEPADQPAREEYLNDCRSLPPAEWLTAVMLPLRPAA